MDAAGRFTPAFSLERVEESKGGNADSGNGVGDPIRQRLLFDPNPVATKDGGNSGGGTAAGSGEVGSVQQDHASAAENAQQQRQPTGTMFDELFPAQENVMLRGSVLGSVASTVSGGGGGSATPWKVLQDSKGNVITIDSGGNRTLDAHGGAGHAKDGDDADGRHAVDNTVFVTGARVVRRLCQSEQSQVWNMLASTDAQFTPTPTLLLLALEDDATVTSC